MLLKKRKSNRFELKKLRGAASRIGLVFGAACITLMMFTADVSSAQEARANPAPWRPSFGPMDRQSQQSQGQAGWNSQSNGATATGANNFGNGQGPAANPNSANPNSANPNSANPNFGNPNLGNQLDVNGWPTPSQPSFGNGAYGVTPPAIPNRNIAGHLGPASPGPQNNMPAYTQQNPGQPAERMARLSSDTQITRVTRTLNQLPNSAGQVWREYDISPYTSRVTTTDNPQQAVLDWVLKETGTQMWFNQPLGVLNATKNQLRVYHTPEVQAEVKKIVDRFVYTRAQLQSIDVNMVTVKNPNWRQTAYSMLQPIEVQSPGVEAWMISKESAALLLNQLSQRGDFRQHSGGRATSHDGQPFILEKRAPAQFVRSVRWMQDGTAQPVMSSVNEGYKLSLCGLTSIDGRTIETTIKCDVDQIEKLTNVKVNVPGIAGVPQQMDLQIPQIVSWRLHERFRWPNDQVLLLSCGVVADPEPGQNRVTGSSPFSGLGRGLLGGRPARRADALLFIDYRGPTVEATRTPASAGTQTPVRMPTDQNQQTFSRASSIQTSPSTTPAQPSLPPTQPQSGDST